MTTNFALSLSFEGIRLLHRVPGGWHLVSDVALDSPDLAAELADLRNKGLQLEPTGMQTKLLIPDSQIKYLSIDSAQTTLDDVHAALEGATPYAIDELVIDFDRTGGRTYIAAVAKETLDEAEAFAADNQFSPVSFAAIPEELTFRNEVFFGPTKIARDILGDVEVLRDPDPVRITGDAVFPVDSDDPQALPSFLKHEDAPTTDVAPPEAEIVFASRNRATADERPARDDAPSEHSDIPEDASAPDAVFVRRQDTPVLAVPTGVVDGPALQDPVPEAAPAPVTPLVADVPEPVAAPPVAPAAGGFASRRSAEVTAPLAAPERPATFEHPADPAPAPAPKAAATARVGGKPKYLGLMLTAGLLVFLFLVALWANTLTDTGLAGLFRSDPVETAPETQEPIIAAAPVVETQPLVAPPEPVEQSPAPSALAPETVVPAPDNAAQPLPIVRAPVGRVLSPAEADRIYAATGVYQRAPRLPLIPRVTSLDGFRQSQPLPISVRPEQATMPPVDLMLPDALVAAPLNPPAAGITFQRDLRGFILATPDGTVTPDGVIVYAGRPDPAPPARPGSETVVETPVAEAPVAEPEGPALVLVGGRPPIVPPLRPEGLVPEDAVIAQTPTQDPAEADEAPAPDDLVASLAVSPGGVDLTGLRPAERPAEPDIQTDAAEETPEVFADPTLAGFRPALRPANLAPALPETPDLTDVIAAIAEAAPPSAFQDVTARAIATSPRPDTRPRNFAQVVARAQAAAARVQPTTAAPAQRAAVAASAAPATPSGPVPGSVAQAATIDNAIRLRDLNLIGVYGRPNARRALVRLSNGRYVKVEVGSTLDGGRVTAIGDSALNFVKRGRTYALQLPQS